MFEITDSALSKVAEVMKEMEVKPIRIFLQQGCGGASIALALDDRKESDHAFSAGDFTFVADSEFMEQAKYIKIDLMPTGFKIDSAMELGGGCGSCGTQGSCCS